MLCSSSAAQPPTSTHIHTSLLRYHIQTLPLSKLSKPAELQRRELGPDFSAVEEPRGPRDTRVTSSESCSISRAQWNNSLPSGTYAKAIVALQRSITLTSIKCYLFSILIYFFLCLQTFLSHVVMHVLTYCVRPRLMVSLLFLYQVVNLPIKQYKQYESFQREAPWVHGDKAGLCAAETLCGMPG